MTTPDEPLGFGLEGYVPVILTRQGERHALRELPRAVKAAFTPLFAVHPISKDLDTGGPSRSIDKHVRQLLRQLAQDWGSQHAFIDLAHLGTDALMDDGMHALLWSVVNAADAGLNLTPVLSAGRHRSYRQAAVRAANAVGTGFCFRLPPDEWADLGTPAGDGRLLTLLSELATSPEQVDLVLDLEASIGEPRIAAAGVRAALRGLPHAHAWRSVTVLGTGMPSATTEVGADSAIELPRTEWVLWRLLRDGADHRVPSFGDYCVQHPDPFSDFDPRYMQSAAQLRYTIPGHWYIVRGRGLRVRGTDQIRNLAAEVMRHPSACPPAFSWGDRWLTDCAAGDISAGNQMVWRKATTNHHLTYAVRQLANVVAS